MEQLFQYSKSLIAQVDVNFKRYVYANINPAFLSPSTTAKFLLPISLTMLNADPLLKQTAGY